MPLVCYICTSDMWIRDGQVLLFYFLTLILYVIFGRKSNFFTRRSLKNGFRGTLWPGAYILVFVHFVYFRNYPPCLFVHIDKKKSFLKKIKIFLKKCLTNAKLFVIIKEPSRLRRYRSNSFFFRSRKTEKPCSPCCVLLRYAKQCK